MMLALFVISNIETSVLMRAIFLSVGLNISMLTLNPSWGSNTSLGIMVLKIQNIHFLGMFAFNLSDLINCSILILQKNFLNYLTYKYTYFSQIKKHRIKTKFKNDLFFTFFNTRLCLTQSHIRFANISKTCLITFANISKSLFL